MAHLGVAGDSWDQETLANFSAIVDVGGNTRFMATPVGRDEDGLVRVKMVDEEGNDVADMCVDCGIGVAVEMELGLSLIHI